MEVFKKNNRIFYFGKRVRLFFYLTCICTYSSYAQRNVVLIIADDLGTDYCGFYEDHADTVALPNLRNLIQKGVRFSNAMSNPVCSATRSGILTGRYSFRTGVGGIVGGGGGSNPLDTSELTIPRLLKTVNPAIESANIGKWHLHQAKPSSNLLIPNKMGFKHFEGPFIGQLPSYTSWTKTTNGVEAIENTYATTENVNNAISWIVKQDSKPFFLWLAFNAPHAPYHLPPSHLHTYTALSGTTQDIAKNPKSYFKAMLQALDTEIGRFCDSLKKMNRYDSTDFIFIGDNGNTIQTAQIASTAKAKGTIYQYGVHVPCIISGPSIIKPGRKCDALVNTTDIFATVLDILGGKNWKSNIPSSTIIDSKSILPLLQNQTTDIRPWAFCENFKLTPDSSDGKAMRNKAYKLIKFDTNLEEFYNLEIDPGEYNNLLNAKLSTNALMNYKYLCNELTTLVDKDFCNPNIGIKAGGKPKISVLSNPFNRHIMLSTMEQGTYFVLTDCFGKFIFSGLNIEEHDFSSLTTGIYYLSCKNSHLFHFKLIKS